MAQNAKRNADDAFSGSQETEQRTKKRRSRPGKKTAIGGDGLAISVVKSDEKSTLQTSTKKVQVSNATLSLSKSPKNKAAPASATTVDAITKSKAQHKSKFSNNVPTKASTSDSNTGKDLVLAKKHKHKNKRRKDKPITQDFSGDDTWRISETSGGIFINHDPVLTPNGKHLILATRSEIQIYSTSTSLMVRSIPVHGEGAISSYAISSTNIAELIVGTYAGFVAKYSIDTGSRTGKWSCPRGLSCFTPIKTQFGGDAILAVYTDDEQDDVLRLITLTKGASKPESTLVLKRNTLQKVMTVTPDGSIIIAYGKDRIHIGQAVPSEPSTTSKQKYNWREVATSGRIVSFDSRTEYEGGKQNKQPQLNVVVGLHNGVIMVYDNLLAKLKLKEKNDQNIHMQGRRLHWHRSAVRSVKWSRDGNYLISGGDESVLVIWQLDTNQKQYLPHLSTSILNLIVSHSGSHYAVRLADNSVMVLATADLTPSTNVTGLSFGANQDLRNTTLLHPQRNSQLIAAVPAHAIGSRSSNATHLQVYDITTNLQLGKQALTRNLTTSVNIGPDGQQLQEPNIVFIQISHNEDWLVTVDQWCPDPLDIQAIDLKSESSDRSQTVQETVLRFWNRSEDNSWEPITRVDEPHIPSAKSVLAIAFNPCALELATIGTDGCLKLWTPKARIRDGVAITSKSGNLLYTWSNTRQFQIEYDVQKSTKEQLSGVLTYSEDGSILAASWSSTSSSQRHVHLIDPKSGAISTSQPHLLTKSPSTLTIMGRYLIGLSTDLIIFDTVTLNTRFNLTIDPKYNSPTPGVPQNKFLAASKGSNLFAVGLNPVNAGKSVPGQIVIFGIDDFNQGCKAEFEIPGQIRALLAEPSGLGFIVIDGDSRIRKITAPGAINNSAMALIAHSGSGMQMIQSETKKNVEDIFGTVQEPGNDVARQLMLEEAEAVQARSQSLDDLLGASTTTQVPGVEEMFSRVAKAVSAIRVGA